MPQIPCCATVSAGSAQPCAPVAPREALRLEGGLGPLQRLGAGGALSFTHKREPSGGARVVAEYAVSGYAPAGLDELAGAVDQVLGAQLARFAAPP